MERMIGICGEICSGCPIYLATQQDDDEERKRVAEMWSTDAYPLQPSDINCDGCVSVAGRHFMWCFECEVRLCGVQRSVPTCAHCEDYGCKTLTQHWEHPPTAQARANLEEIRESLQE
jgi:hypothetical protein